MSTLSADYRALLILVYLAWVVCGPVAVVLFFPAWRHRLARLGYQVLFDPVATFLAGVMLLCGGSTVGIGYFMFTMRMAIEGQLERLAWWKANLIWLPIIGQSVAVLGIALLIHGYFLESAFGPKSWRRILVHFAVGGGVVAIVVYAEMADWWW